MDTLSILLCTRPSHTHTAVIGMVVMLMLMLMLRGVVLVLLVHGHTSEATNCTALILQLQGL